MLKRLSSLPASAMTRLAAMWREFYPAANHLQGETGARLASDTAMDRMYRTMWLDTERRAMVQTIRDMDRRDGRVKAIHRKLAADCIRGGLVLQVSEKASSETLKREWLAMKGRMQLDMAEKLRSDARGFVMEGNLPLQLVLNERLEVVAGIRMPSDTILPITDARGRFKNPAQAWEQRDVMTGTTLASWPAYQMAVARLDPDNFDDLGSMGRPFLDACATVWRKLVMTEEDLVIRRRQRAPLRMAHVLEGADETALDAYRQRVEGEKNEISTDYYLNRRGGVTAVQGDATLGDIGDVTHLLDSFYAGSPAPKGLFGYTDGMARDILEDLKRSYYDEVDSLQDSMAAAYAVAFRIHLLFKGIDPGTDEFTLRYAQRRTETPNQVADLALKYMALGLPDDMVFADMGLDPDLVRAKRTEQAQRNDPYPPAAQGAGRGQGGMPRVSVTPGNAPKGESATAVSQAGGNGGKGRH